MLSALEIAQLFGLLELAVGLLIVGLAFQGYRQNRSRAMLFLGAGIATLTVVATASTLLLGSLAGPRTAATVDPAINLVGMCLLLYAIVLARRE